MAAEGHCPERLARLARRGGNRQRKTVNGKGLGKANPRRETIANDQMIKIDQKRSRTITATAIRRRLRAARGTRGGSDECGSDEAGYAWGILKIRLGILGAQIVLS